MYDQEIKEVKSRTIGKQDIWRASSVKSVWSSLQNNMYLTYYVNIKGTFYLIKGKKELKISNLTHRNANSFKFRTI